MSKLRTLLKNVLVEFWQFLTYLTVKMSFANLDLMQRGNIKPRVFYSGALGGNRGGPRVKVARLNEIFPNTRIAFDVVYVLSNYPYLTRNALREIKSKKIPLVINQNGVYTPGWYGKGWDIRNRKNADIYKSSNYVFWQSNFARVCAREFLYSVEPPGEVLFNAVNLEIFRPTTSSRTTGLFRYLIAGNFNSHRSLYQIQAGLRAFKEIPNLQKFELVIAGISRGLIKEVQKIASEFRIQEHVQILGKFSQRDCPDLLRSVDVYLALKYQDTCPNLVVEALASGLPVIYSATGGTPELVESTCGIGLAVPEDWDSEPIAPGYHELSEAMKLIVDSKSEMRMAARQSAVESFDIRHWYARHSEIFHRLIDERHQK